MKYLIVILSVVVLAAVIGVVNMRDKSGDAKLINELVRLKTKEVVKRAPLPEKNVKLEAELKPVKDVTGSGKATSEFNGSQFSHTVEATLADPAEGSFYQAWLVRGKPEQSDFHYFSTGKLTKNGDKYTLTYTAETDYRDHPGVAVTIETTEDDKPEKYMLRGTLQQVK